MLFVVIELLLAVLVVLGVVTQIIIPLQRKTPFFPAFKKADSGIETELELARHKVKVAQLENERDELLKQAENLRNQPKEGSNVQ